MQCQHACELLSDYVAGDIDRALKVTIENHLADCPRCRDEAEGLRRIWGALGEKSALEPPPFFHENIMSRIQLESQKMGEERERKRAAWNWRNLLRPRALAYAAAAIVVLLAGAHSTQQTVLDPVGWLIRLAHPAPAPDMNLQTARAEWATGDRAPCLVLHLRAARTNGRRATLNYSADVAGHHLAGTISSEMDTVVYIPFTSPPGDVASAIVTISPTENDGAQTKVVSVVIPPQPSAHAPAAAPDPGVTP